MVYDIFRRDREMVVRGRPTTLQLHTHILW